MSYNTNKRFPEDLFVRGQGSNTDESHSDFFQGNFVDISTTISIDVLYN